MLVRDRELNSRRAAAFAVARWIATHGHLNEMLPEGPDRAFVQDLAYTTVRRFRALRSVLGRLVPKWPKGEMEALLLVGAAQILYMPDVPDFAAVNEAYARVFPAPFPARSCVQVAAIPKGARIEVEVIAARSGA